MPLLLDQLVYTSFPKVGFKTLVSAGIPQEIQQVFIQKVVYQYWNSYNPPEFEYQAAYLHQVTQKDNLFGWLYEDGLDDLSRSHVPYFVCYYLKEPLNIGQLESIFTCLQRGPIALVNRQNLAADLEVITVPDLGNYQPARPGVAIPPEMRERSKRVLEQGQLLDLFIPIAEREVCNDRADEPLNHSQKVLRLNHVREVLSMTQPQRQWKWGLRAKATAWALAVSMIPVLAVGTTYYVGSQSIAKRITPARQASAPDLAHTERALQRQLLFLLAGTGGTAVLAGAIAAFLNELGDLSRPAYCRRF